MPHPAGDKNGNRMSVRGRNSHPVFLPLALFLFTFPTALGGGRVAAQATADRQQFEGKIIRDIQMLGLKRLKPGEVQAFECLE